MSKKMMFLISFVSVLVLVSVTYGSDVVSDFEEGLDGWEPYPGIALTSEMMSIGTTGATLHDYGMRVYSPSGTYWGIRLDIQAEPWVVAGNNHVSFDVTWIASEWEGSTWAKIEAIAITGDGMGWQEVAIDPNVDPVSPDYPGVWSPGWGDHTRKLTWDYSSIDTSGLSENPTYLYFILPLQSDIGGPFYFDNVVFFDSVYANTPSPPDTQTDVPIETDFSWTAGDYAQYHDIYFGTSFAEVNDADNSGDPCATEVYRARQAVGEEDYVIPETLEVGKTYYWRIDEVSDTCAPGLWKGEVWSFTTQCKARNPNPANRATEVQRTSLELSWRPGFDGAEHDVYFGTSFEDVNGADNSGTPGPTEVYRAHQDANTYTVPEILKTDQTYFWRIDEVNDSCSLYFKGDVWEFATITAKAQNPYPVDEGTGVYIHAIELAWTTGPYAASHDVYFGADYNDVLNANDNDTTGIFRGNQTETEYPLINLDLETTYYWRIDEVNEAHEDVNWTGDIWSFTIPDYITIDDFEYYTVSASDGEASCPYYDGNDLRLDLNNDMRFWWLDGHVQKNPQGNCTSAISDYNPLALEGSIGRLPGSRIIRADNGQSGYGMSYFYDNNDVNNAAFPPETTALEDHYSEILRYYAGGIDLTPDDKVNASFLAIELFYMGQLSNDCDPVYDRMYVGLEDTCDVGTYGQGHYAYVDHLDPNAAKKGTWQQWAIELSDFTDENPDLDLNHIESVRIGFGLRGNPDNGPVGGEGTVIFDDIRVFEQRCVSEFGPAGDFDSDCFVSYLDLIVMVSEWLSADETLEYDPIVEPNAPVLWYKFNETAGDVTTNWAPSYGSYDPCDFDGTVENLGEDTWDTSGGRDGSGCIALLPDSDTFVDVPPEVLNFANDTQKISFSVWVNDYRDYPQDQWNGIFGVRAADNEDPWQGTEVVEAYCPTPLPPRNLYGPRAGWRVGAVNPPDPCDPWCSSVDLQNLLDFAERWNHYVFIKDADADLMQIYHNGMKIAETSDVNADNPMFDTPVGKFYVGTRNIWWSHYIGRIDDFQVYDYVLSQQEAAYLATDGTGSLYLELLTPTDLYVEDYPDPNVIDFKDYAVLAENWLQKKLWPQP